MLNKKTVLYAANITARLLLICLVVAALVAAVFVLTEKPIAEGERARKESAIRLIFAEANGFEEDAAITGDGINTVYVVKDANAAPLGWCVDYTGTSDYGGDVNMMIGVGLDGKVTGVQVISHAETFIDRYLDEENRYTGVKNAYGEDLSAGATMSYNAIRNAMDAVEAIFRAHATESPAPAPTACFEAADVQLLFADAADWQETGTVVHPQVNGVRAVKNGAGQLLGYAVHYTATGGYYGGAQMLLSVGTEGRVMDVLLLDFADDRMYYYLDEQERYNGADEVGVASKSYRMIRNAITTVEGLQLGGVQ